MLVGFLQQILDSQPRGKEIHLILVNLSAHKSATVTALLSSHSNVHMHFTPTYASWLDQIENWLTKTERDVIARGIISSVKDLARKLTRYIRRDSKRAKPTRWTHVDTFRRIPYDSAVAGH